MLILISYTFSFADTELIESRHIEKNIDYNEMPLIFDDEKIEKSSLTGDYGTAYIGYGSGVRALNRRG